MIRLAATARRLLTLAAIVLPAALPLAARADAVTYFVPFGGTGNVSVFDAVAGTGGWVGSIDQTAPPVVADPLSFVSVVLFQLDALTQTLTGTFEFTTTDLVSTLFGTLTGTYAEADILNTGGQFSLDYSILGGTGAFATAQGFGLSFVDFNPAGAFDNYAEAGLLNFSVPEPGSLALLATGLLGAAVVRRKPRPLN